MISNTDLGSAPQNLTLFSWLKTIPLVFLVGEVDDDYVVGTSSFTNCYVANSTVTAFTEEVQGVSFAGEFAGEMTACALTLKNCFVYNNTAAIGEGSAPPTLKKQAYLLPTYGEAQ